MNIKLFSLLISILVVNALTGVSVEAQGMVSTYSDVVKTAKEKGFSSASVYYHDPRIATRIALRPETLLIAACRVDLEFNTPKWDKLVAVLEAETPRILSGSLESEVKWGVVFHGPRQEETIFFGAYYGPQSEGTSIFGYVNGLPVLFSAELPRSLFPAVIRGTNCDK